MENSPLRRLSPELRNRIYEYVFAGCGVMLDDFKDDIGYPTALVQTCRELRSEAYVLMFATVRSLISYDTAVAFNDIPAKLYATFGQNAVNAIKDGYIDVVGYDQATMIRIRPACYLCQHGFGGNHYNLGEKLRALRAARAQIEGGLTHKDVCYGFIQRKEGEMANRDRFTFAGEFTMVLRGKARGSEGSSPLRESETAEE